MSSPVQKRLVISKEMCTFAPTKKKMPVSMIGASPLASLQRTTGRFYIGSWELPIRVRL